jgi:hypothetical protein
VELPHSELYYALSKSSVLHTIAGHGGQIGCCSWTLMRCLQSGGRTTLLPCPASAQRCGLLLSNEQADRARMGARRHSDLLPMRSRWHRDYEAARTPNILVLTSLRPPPSCELRSLLMMRSKSLLSSWVVPRRLARNNTACTIPCAQATGRAPLAPLPRHRLPQGGPLAVPGHAMDAAVHQRQGGKYCDFITAAQQTCLDDPPICMLKPPVYCSGSTGAAWSQ